MVQPERPSTLAIYAVSRRTVAAYCSKMLPAYMCSFDTIVLLLSAYGPGEGVLIRFAIGVPTSVCHMLIDSEGFSRRAANQWARTIESSDIRASSA